LFLRKVLQYLKKKTTKKLGTKIWKSSKEKSHHLAVPTLFSFCVLFMHSYSTANIDPMDSRRMATCAVRAPAGLALPNSWQKDKKG